MENAKGRLSTRKTVKCLLRQSLGPIRPLASHRACPAQKERRQEVHGTCRESPALLSVHSGEVPITATTSHCTPAIPAPVIPVTTVIATGIVLAFTCGSRNKCSTSLFSLLLPQALGHNIRGKA